MKFPRNDRVSAHRRGFFSIAGLGRPERSAAEPGSLIRAARPAMACDFEILFPASLRESMMTAHHALDFVGRLEELMTVYRDDSQISLVNREAHRRSVELDRNLFQLLQTAVELSHRTGGAFDAASGALTRCWGFDRRQGRLPSQAEIDEALRRVGSRHLILEEKTTSVRFANPVQLNLGAIGKGYALDCAARTLRRGGIDNALLHAGFSSLLGVGPGPFGDGWPVGLRHPLQPGRNLAELRLRNRALAYSGPGEQNFVSGDRRFGHVLDPRTGRPAEHRAMAAAVAPTAAEADALSTAFCLMDLAEVEDYCRTWPRVGAVVATGESLESMEIRTFGLDNCLTEVVC